MFTTVRLSTFWSESLGYFTLNRWVCRDYTSEQVLAAALLVMQSGE